MEHKILHNMSIIVAIAANNAIGKDNRLLWHLSDDLKRFKMLTTGHTLIMGRNTFLSLPNGALPNRRHIVISDIPDENFEGCEMAYSIEEAIDKCPDHDECFIIGGGMIYKQFIDKVDKLYITFVHKIFPADTYFPKFNRNEWTLIEEEKHDPEGNLDFSYSYTVFERKSS